MRLWSLPLFLTDITRLNVFEVQSSARHFLLEMLVRDTKYEVARAGL